MNEQIVAGGSDYFVPNHEMLYMKVDVDKQIVTYGNIDKEISKVVLLPACFRGQELYLFSTMGNKGDSVTIL